MSFLCSACSAQFDDNFSRREHMREQWHVFNVKRRVAALPPISNDTYQAVFAPPAKSETSSDSNSQPVEDIESTRDASEPSNIGETLPFPSECIFCLNGSGSAAQNLNHMAASHGLVLPELEKLRTDLETLISYLHLVVADYCECLFCGVTKRSAHAARAHMLAKGHCMLDFSEGSEFLEFWELETQEDKGVGSENTSYQLLSKTEMRLASGAIATSCEDANSSTYHRPRRSLRDVEPPKEIPTTSEQSEEPCEGIIGDRVDHQDQRHIQTSRRTLAVRDELGLIGLSDAQRRSLAVSQRKIDMSALRSRNKAQWTLESMGNKVKQKHFVVGSPCRSGWFLDPIMR